MVDVVTLLVAIALVALVWFAINAREMTSQPATTGSGTLTWKTVGES